MFWNELVDYHQDMGLIYLTNQLHQWWHEGDVTIVASPHWLGWLWAL